MVIDTRGQSKFTEGRESKVMDHSENQLPIVSNVDEVREKFLVHEVRDEI